MTTLVGPVGRMVSDVLWAFPHVRVGVWVCGQQSEASSSEELWATVLDPKALRAGWGKYAAPLTPENFWGKTYYPYLPR